MNPALRIIVFISLVAVPCEAAPPAQVHFLAFAKSDIEALGQIDKLNVTVACSWIASFVYVEVMSGGKVCLVQKRKGSCASHLVGADA
jgi:hypothetical protein